MSCLKRLLTSILSPARLMGGICLRLAWGLCQLYWYVHGSELFFSVEGVLIDLGVGPLADGGLDEAFGLAIGSRSVDAGAGVFYG